MVTSCSLDQNPEHLRLDSSSQRDSKSQGVVSEHGGFRTLTPQDLLDLNIPEPEWLVEDILPKGYVVVLSGPPKSGKGLLTLDMIASIAEGSSFLSKSVAQGPVMYVSAEEPLGEVKVRFLNRIGDEGVDLPIHILPVDGTFTQSLKIENSTDVAKLTMAIRRVKPVLIVFDVLRMMNDLEENDSDDMSRIMNEIRKLARSSGAAIVVSHHMNKNGVQRGSNAIAGGADITIDLTPNAGSDGSLSASFTAKGRSVPPISLSIRFDGEARWIATDSGNSFSPPTLTIEKQILEYLRTTVEQQFVRDIAVATGNPERSVGTQISTIKRKYPGLLVETHVDGQGTPKLYRIPNESNEEVTAA